MNAIVRAERLRLPRMWLGLSFVVWGAWTDQLILGCSLAAIAEFSEISPIKWDLTQEHYYRIADLSSVFFVLLAVYQFNEHSVYGIYHILALLPVCVFPLLAAERYSTAAAIPLGALFLSLRRQIRRGQEQERYVSVAFPYVIITILASSAGATDPAWYFGSAFVLSLGALYTERSGRFSVPRWIGAVAAVAIVAGAIQTGVRLLQVNIEDSLTYWFNQHAWFQTDPRRELTSIGTIGRLKLSDRIRVRVKTPLSTPLPIPLHEASYSTFKFGTWSAPAGFSFSSLDPLPQTTRWLLDGAPAPSTNRAASIVIDHPEDVGVAPLPYGTSEISGGELIEVQRNGYGTTLVEALPGQLEYQISWGTAASEPAPPTPADRSIPADYAELFRSVATEIGLRTDDPAAALEQVKQFFAENFHYSLVQKGFYPGRTPLAHFLQRHRSGHCEYFATATALLLRQAGIPTRYAVGYMVSEYSPLEKAFIARARHAHSWVEAYVDDRWITVDTTPGEWSALESADPSAWQYVQDVWSWISNRYARYQRTERESIVDSLVWLLPPMILFLLWRIRSRARSVGGNRREHTVHAVPRGVDSELYDVTRLLAERGYEMHPGDTLQSFLERHIGTATLPFSIRHVVRLHYRYRFTGAGLSPQDRETLREQGAFLRRHLEASAE